MGVRAVRDEEEEGRDWHIRSSDRSVIGELGTASVN